MERKTRTRVSKFKLANIEQIPDKGYVNPDGSKSWYVVTKGATVELPGTQSTESEGHERGRDGKFHEGGPFNTGRSEFSIGSADYEGKRKINGATQRLKGQVFCPWPTVPVGFAPPPFKPYDQHDRQDIDEDGATAIARCAPTNPSSKLAVLLGEIKKDGIPSIPSILTWKKRTELARLAGNDYLSYQFGWRPLVEETLQVGNSARHSAQLVKQHQADEGKNVRRRYEFPVGATLTREESHSRRKWFSGAFTYALPSRTDSMRKMLGYGTEAEKLFGITITPDVLWELAPWSWAVDWFSNAGDVIHNVTNFAAAGLVMRYGYMCEENRHTILNTLDNMNLIGSERRGVGGSQYNSISKTRYPANPFGFGITAPDLSPTQIAITVALGITKL